MNESPPRYGGLSRGVTQADVSRAADALLRVGERPTVERIRAAIGSGSPNTVGPLLDVWWKRLAGRLDSGPAAFHRLPESVAHVAEALWMQALEEGRRRALLEQHAHGGATAREKEWLEVRSHVLSLREAELEEKVRGRERAYSELEEQIRSLTLLLRKEQASRLAAEGRSARLEIELAAKSLRFGKAGRQAMPSKRNRRRTGAIVPPRKP
jgi:hypothetical protein